MSFEKHGKQSCLLSGNKKDVRHLLKYQIRIQGLQFPHRLSEIPQDLTEMVLKAKFLSETIFFKKNRYCILQVVNTSPLAGMVISPKNGVVPVGGTTEIKVYFVTKI